MTSSTDRIEKRLFLRAPQERVWRALSDAGEFGSWFGMELDGPFAAGAHVTGRVKSHGAHDGVAVAFYIDRVDPTTTFSFRWHPFALDPAVDYSKEPMTLVTFKLVPAEGGTMLTVLETGFDSIPIERRADAFEANEEGWATQMERIEKYLLLPQS